MFQKQREVQLYAFPYLLHTDSLSACVQMGTSLGEVCVCEDWEEGMDHSGLGNGVFENYFKQWDVPRVLVRAGNKPRLISSKMKGHSVMCSAVSFQH